MFVYISINLSRKILKYWKTVKCIVVDTSFPNEKFHLKVKFYNCQQIFQFFP